MHFCRIILLCILCSTAINVTGAHPLDEWTWVTPKPTRDVLTYVGHMNGSFIAVGRKGTVITSGDGADWTVHKRPPGAPCLTAIAYGNGTYVTVGEVGFLARSADLSSWVVIPSETEDNITDIAFGNGHFVAVTSAGHFLRSSDGMEWTTMTSILGMTPDYSRFNDPTILPVFPSMRFVQGRFWSTADEFVLVSSEDGLTWEFEKDFGFGPISNVATDGTDLLVGVAHGFSRKANGEAWGEPVNFDGTTPVIEDNGRLLPREFVSGDGKVFSMQSPHRIFNQFGSSGLVLGKDQPASQTDFDISLFSWVDHEGTLVGVGAKGEILRSTDWSTFETAVKSSIPSGFIFIDMAKKDQRFVAIGYHALAINDQRYYSVVSDDLENWTTHQIDAPSGLINIVSGEQGFIARTGYYNEEQSILFSADGVSWEKRTVKAPPILIRQVLHLNGNWVIFLPDGPRWSQDTITWNEVESYEPGENDQQVVAKGHFWVLGGSFVERQLFKSQTGESWTQCPPLPEANGPDYLTYIIGFAEGLVLVATKGALVPSRAFLSTDGETWTEVSHPAYRTALTSPWSDRTIGLTKINSSKPWGVYVPEPSVSAWTSTDLSSASAHDLPPITVVPQYRIPLFFVDGHYIALTEDGIMKSGPVVDVGFSNPGKNGQRTLSLKGPSGRSYELQSAPDANGPWSTLMQFQSQNGNTEQTVTTGDSKGFFRLIMDE